ncbi:pseudouridylate synthase TRUB2, mitochondrial [Phymastichus coffea]|uniref:pseudouridylate synthase TRUB2, mitochondrial n=1 Tax=Phymastichus coffea TaxID=108790 RepID=UPI00273B541C|nr:pseudouridylate synthase TRUB2, mitochondrial [Phymastichus coffea]XP_058800011.1 pseudouridylate synthase TRUB2, mitochondrial [Phymastichus coffea]XP_058800012.1 pseudouridylate synthase TRUB2, mitochondrial [Phymastichus coffea]XP_058800013.1 pseudouridylate synthase TRUB2, mitochondrial [Phymastichus coffea]XP_058800014.1 pseudouridylate synthase TRUB2, mitochondrial [Phymastichus coffea]XP_058800015.1 pseudouridylate synthase TRUB2, mitochondrial [Phymastichus coffea]XP_058800016.1 ps
MSRLRKDPKLVWNILNGVFLVYKPPNIHYLNVRDTIIQNLCRDLNAIKERPLMKHVSIEGATNEVMQVVVSDSYAHHPLVTGPQYIPDDFKCATANSLTQETSGILVCGINAGTRLCYQLKLARVTRFYRVKGILGQARENDFATGKILEKSLWKGIKRFYIDRICASIQASHQKKMFELCGIDIQSQAAYDLAVQGLIRPANPKIPMIYTIKCVDFQPPEFTLEIVCINEEDNYLKSLAAEVGYKLKSTAYCSYIQCTQFGMFNVKDALLSKHWDLQNILDNIDSCHKILEKHPYMLKQEHAHLVAQSN